MTLEEINATLVVVNDAILKLVQGKRLTELRIGSGNFSRNYRYGEVTIEDLKNYRAELLQLKYTLEDSGPTFRKGASYQVTSVK